MGSKGGGGMTEGHGRGERTCGMAAGKREIKEKGGRQNILDQ